LSRFISLKLNLQCIVVGAKQYSQAFGNLIHLNSFLKIPLSTVKPNFVFGESTKCASARVRNRKKTGTHFVLSGGVSGAHEQPIKLREKLYPPPKYMLTLLNYTSDRDVTDSVTDMLENISRASTFPAKERKDPLETSRFWLCFSGSYLSVTAPQLNTMLLHSTRKTARISTMSTVCWKALLCTSLTSGTIHSLWHSDTYMFRATGVRLLATRITRN
jgi:hypothetical protein